MLAALLPFLIACVDKADTGAPDVEPAAIAVESYGPAALVEGVPMRDGHPILMWCTESQCAELVWWSLDGTLYASTSASAGGEVTIRWLQ